MTYSFVDRFHGIGGSFASGHGMYIIFYVGWYGGIIMPVGISPHRLSFRCTRSWKYMVDVQDGRVIGNIDGTEENLFAAFVDKT